MTRMPRNRLVAIESWWRQLSALDRERARYFAASDERLPQSLFVGLCDAGVLAVDHHYRVMVEAAEAHTFPMPSDIRAYIQQTGAPEYFNLRAS